jgi:mRNA interferase RelE/StbE
LAWTIEVSRKAERQLERLDRRTAARLLDYLEDRVATAVDPRALGKALQGNLRGTWRYRVGDYRLICKIEDRRITIVVVEIGHRRDIYD